MRQPNQSAVSSLLCWIIATALSNNAYGQACEVLDDQLLFVGPFGNLSALSPVAVDGDWAVVGLSPPGQAYVVHKDSTAPPGDAWGAPVQLVPTDPVSTVFGTSVAISGDAAIVGEPSGTGAAYVFRSIDGQWTQETKLSLLSVKGDTSTFGVAVDIAGDVAVVAQKWSAPGSAHVFRAVESGWELEQSLVITGSFPTGMSVAISPSGDRIIVGAPSASGGTGRASVFHHDGTKWIEEAQLSVGTNSASFGTSVDVQGDRVVVGAPPRSYAFAFDGSTWNLAQTFGPLSGTFGASLALDADVLVIGAPTRDPETVYSPQTPLGNHGSVYKYRWDRDQWALDYIMVSGRSGRTGKLGRSVAISGNSIIASGMEIGLWATPGAASASAFSTQAPDCNDNGIPDRCDAPDCDHNSRIDLCPSAEPDCNANGIPDQCEAQATYVLDDGQVAAMWTLGSGSGLPNQMYDLLLMSQFNVVQAGQIITHIDIAWNGFATEGHPMKLLIYDDPNNDGNPEDAALISTFDLKTRAYGDHTSESTFTRIEIPPTFVGELGDSFFIGAISKYDSAGFGCFFGDGTATPGRSFFYWNFAGQGDYKDPAGTMVLTPAGDFHDFMLRALALDCNGNGTWDQCDIDNGISADTNANGLPDECESSCAADIAPPGGKGNSVVDVDDLLKVINSWGVCESGEPCEADVAPPGGEGDGEVNVDDLLFIINNWGPCV